MITEKAKIISEYLVGQYHRSEVCVQEFLEMVNVNELNSVTTDISLMDIKDAVDDVVYRVDDLVSITIDLDDMSWPTSNQIKMSDVKSEDKGKKEYNVSFKASIDTLLD